MASETRCAQFVFTNTDRRRCWWSTKSIARSPTAGEVLIRVHFAGVNPIDWKLRAGYLQAVHADHAAGHAGTRRLAGTVEALGEGVTGFAIGDRVFGRGAGTYAEFAVAPIATRSLRSPTAFPSSRRRRCTSAA